MDKGDIEMGRFVIKSTVNNEFMFNLIAENNEVIATSQTYKSVDNAKVGIESVKVNACASVEDKTANAAALPCPKFEIFNDAEGKFRFHLMASNGEIVAASQGYTTKENCQKGIASVKSNAPKAEVVKEC